MKRVIAVILTVMMFVGLVSGCSGSNEKHFEYEDVSGGIKITKYTGNSSEVVVPETIDGKLVVSVGETFSGNVNITSLELPEKCEEADLSNCINLAHLTASIQVVSTVGIGGLDSLKINNTKYFYLDEGMHSWMNYAKNLKKLDISSANIIELVSDYKYDEDWNDGSVYTVTMEHNFCKIFPNLKELVLAEDLGNAITLKDIFLEEYDYYIRNGEYRCEGNNWDEICQIGNAESELITDYPKCMTILENEYNETILNALGYDELTINGVKCKK